MRTTTYPAAREPDPFLAYMKLAMACEADYVALRLMYTLEWQLCATPILAKAVEVCEKAMKAMLLSHEEPSEPIAWMLRIGHDVERLRSRCAELAPAFGRPELVEFFRPFAYRKGRLFQLLRYGIDLDLAGYETNVGTVMRVTDAVVLNAFANTRSNRRDLFLSGSFLAHVIADNGIQPANNRQSVLNCLAHGNESYADLMALYANARELHRSRLDPDRE